MALRLVQRRTVWLPTWIGAGVLLIAGTLPLFAWARYGEAFLGTTRRIDNADGLIVEGWIGIEGIRAAAEEFSRGGEHYLITTGSPSSTTWNAHPISYAAMAEYELVRAGVPAGKIIVAPAPSVDTERTYTAAEAVAAALLNHGLHPKRLNLFSSGTHARRSRLVFSKVLGPDVAVGVIAWRSARDRRRSWWQSSDRAIDFLTESIGYPYEALFSSGRAFVNH